ncbi:MAG TPA: glycosyltransferase family 4 protein [Tepidisphaeraceae bacterium]|jgi:glycosyltransferase involved in cell wall biosynthesis|nr:glycosyltransferase family 4 protein [Tepidisphaeraceae bacterium]
MKVLVAHNFYQQPGGEDQVFDAEVALLRRFGHDARRFVMHNDAVDGMGRIALVRATIWNRRTYRDLREQVRTERPDVVHFHNTFPLISPAAYSAARAGGAAVVQTLHNFRLLCPGALLYRDGKVCEECIGRTVPWPGVAHKCYRHSAPASATVAVSLTVHRAVGTFDNAVDLYIAPTESARRKFVQGGLPENKIFVKPNFVDPDPGPGEGNGGYAVFVARLSHEKGLHTLLSAWEKLGARVPLKIIGDGPLAGEVAAAAERFEHIEWRGHQPLADVYDIIGRAKFCIFPSECYETFGRVVVEAFSKGTPVIASRLGAMADLVDHGRTGLLFNPGNAEDLAAQVRRLLNNPAVLDSMRREARAEYVSKYTGEANHRQLMKLYDLALRQANVPSEPTEEKIAIGA